MTIKANIQKGFTLIELMIVVAIVGILASVAVPAYQDYTVRAKISECIGIYDACKTAVNDVFASKLDLPTSATDAGCQATGTQYCNSPTISVSGNILKMTIGTTTAATGTTCNLVFRGTKPTLGTAGNTTDSITWGTDSTTTCSLKYLPSNLRTTLT